MIIIKYLKIKKALKINIYSSKDKYGYMVYWKSLLSAFFLHVFITYSLPPILHSYSPYTPKRMELVSSDFDTMLHLGVNRKKTSRGLPSWFCWQ